MPKKWIIHRAIGYVVVAAVVVGILAIKDEPGKQVTRFTSDQLRPWLAGIASYCAIAAWNWVSGNAKETWEYTRFWAVSFLVTLLIGSGILVFLGRLSDEQGILVLAAIFIGMLIGFVEVASKLSKNDRIY